MFPQNIFRIGPKNYSFDVNTGFLLQVIEHRSERSTINMWVYKSIELKSSKEELEPIDSNLGDDRDSNQRWGGWDQNVTGLV